MGFLDPAIFPDQRNAVVLSAAGMDGAACKICIELLYAIIKMAGKSCWVVGRSAMYVRYGPGKFSM